MNRKTVSGIILTLLLICTLMLAFNIKSVKASGTIYIRADGSVDPPTAPIHRDGNLYTFTDNIDDSIMVEKNHVIVNGDGYILQGELRLFHRNNVTIKTINITQGGGISALFLNNSTNCIISGNTLTNIHSDHGIILQLSSYNDVVENTVIRCRGNAGIRLYDSSNNSVFGNTVIDCNNYGLLIDQCSSYNIFRNNSLIRNKYNFAVRYSRYQSGNYLTYFLHDIDTSNTVDGKPIYYLVNQKDLTLDSFSDPPVGYLGLVNCTNMTVKNLTITDNCQGVLFAYVTNSTIKNCVFTHNLYGAYIRYSAFITLIDNTMVNNAHGIDIWNSWGDAPSGHHTIKNNSIAENTYGGINVWYSPWNSIMQNTISNKTWYTDPLHFPGYGGITLKFSNGGNITGNIFINNSCGIYNYWSSYFVVNENILENNAWGIYLEYLSIRNAYYHNNLIDNNVQVHVSQNVEDVWNDGYPSGGNYWSDYCGNDSYSGPSQNETGSDGIGDTPYNIDETNQDRFPLMNQWGESKTLYVPTRYKTIQEAIDAANEGDTIFVYSGIYYENVMVNKTVSLTGENRNTTIIDGNETGKVVEIIAPNVVLTEFTVKNSGAYPNSGISASSNCSISGNILTDNYFGISFSTNNTISGNDVRNNHVGIRGGSHSLIENNTVKKSHRGIFIEGKSNTISGNNVSECSDGIQLFSGRASDCVVVKNTIIACGKGVNSDNNLRVRIIENMFVNNSEGARSSGDKYNIFINNTFLTNSMGLHLRSTYYEGLTGNNFSGNVHNLKIYVTSSWVQFLKSIDTSNTVNGKKIYYFNNQRNLLIDLDSFPDIGWLAVVNSQPPYTPLNVTIRNLTLANMDQGVFLGHASGVRIENCNIRDNLCGIRVTHTMSPGNVIYHNNFINNIQQVSEDSWSSVQNIWDDGYPSGGNYWSDYDGNDTYSGPYQNGTGSDGIGDTPYFIDEDNQDNYPLMIPWPPHQTVQTSVRIAGEDYPITIEGNTTITHVTATRSTLHFKTSGPDGTIGHINVTFPVGLNKTAIKVFVDGDKLTPPPFPVITTNGTHYFIYFEFTLSTREIVIQYAIADIAVTNVTTSKTIVGEGHPLNINITIQNQGDNEETFNVTAYYDETAMILLTGKNYTTVTLSSGNSTTVTLTWNATGVAKGNYTISAYVYPIPFETDTDDNMYSDGTILVTIAGDVNGDGVVDIFDLTLAGHAFGSWYWEPRYDPNADITNDGHVDMRDIMVICRNYGKIDP